MQLRHSNVNTTDNVYTKPIPQSVKDAAEALDHEIRQAHRQGCRPPEALTA